MQSHNARLGLVLFAVYLACYAAFIAVNAYDAELMDRAPFGGVNLAVLSGGGLIALAFVLALTYGVAAKDDAAPSPSVGEAPEGSR
ncbi:MAG: DUF485 domain-containing protein [Lacipirellulaceae bacterium]